MVTLDVPDSDVLAGLSDVTVEEFPRFAPVTRHRDPPEVDDVDAVVREALADIPALSDLPRGSEVAITAGSRGIEDMPPLIAATVAELESMGLVPFVIPAMGSHGGATAEGQTDVLGSYGITEEHLGCEIRADMAVTKVGTDGGGRPVFVADVALEADAVLLANRVKLHTDFDATIQSGLCKMAVVGLGKQRGAEAMHNAGLRRGLGTVIRERARIIFEKAPVIGGVALLENANHRAAAIEGIPVANILEREPDLLEHSRALFPGLPIEDLDLLIVDELGKDISGTGMDTNVIGRILFDDVPEPETPDITRIAVRDVTKSSHGNAFGVGLANFVHQRVVDNLDLTEMYVNAVTSGVSDRVHIPIIVPNDRTMLFLAASMTGVRDPAEMRVARIRNTLEPDNLLVSEPVAQELEGREDTSIEEMSPLTFDERGDFANDGSSP